MPPRVIAVSQARMTSSRLPGKVLLPVLGKPLLSYHLARARKARHIDRLVVATTVNVTDDPIVEFCKTVDVPVFRGNENDVLSRYEGAVQAYGGDADIVMRITSDCPLIDPDVLDGLVEMFKSSEPALDYAAVDGTCFPHGLDAEVFTRSALAEAANKADLPDEREHVTPYIYRHQPRFRCGAYSIAEDYSANRWCVDEAADFDLISRILAALVPENPAFGWRDCIRLLDQNPDWRALNAAVTQKQAADILLRSGAKTD